MVTGSSSLLAPPVTTGMMSLISSNASLTDSRVDALKIFEACSKPPKACLVSSAEIYNNVFSHSVLYPSYNSARTAFFLQPVAISTITAEAPDIVPALLVGLRAGNSPNTPQL
jgi:hypothetical protein